jgi:hypothetical protein
MTLAQREDLLWPSPGFLRSELLEAGGVTGSEMCRDQGLPPWRSIRPGGTRRSDGGSISSCIIGGKAFATQATRRIGSGRSSSR